MPRGSIQVTWRSLSIENYRIIRILPALSFESRLCMMYRSYVGSHAVRWVVSVAFSIIANLSIVDLNLRIIQQTQ